MLGGLGGDLALLVMGVWGGSVAAIWWFSVGDDILDEEGGALRSVTGLG